MAHARAISAPVGTKQVAPTILRLLDLKPEWLHAVKAEDTRVLPGIGEDR